jgi:hypothetical protein
MFTADGYNSVALLSFCRYQIHTGEQLAVVQVEYDEY